MLAESVPFGPVAIFWDYENCSPHHSAGSIVIDNIRQIAHQYGTVKLFKAYLELSEQNSLKSLGLRSELQSCGVSLTDCPHNGRKDVADKMMIVDMLTYAIDTPAPATIILISGDRDFVYAVSVLRFRRYNVVVIAPGSAHASLKSRASELLDWDHDVLGKPLRDTHARHVSVDIPQGRSSWNEQAASPHRSNRRHSFRDHVQNPPFLNRSAASPARPPGHDSDTLQDTLRVPVLDSFPPTPLPRVRTLDTNAVADAHGSDIQSRDADANALRPDGESATANTTSPISPGINTSKFVAEGPSGPTTPCDNAPDGLGEGDRIGVEVIAEKPIGQRLRAVSLTAASLRSESVAAAPPAAPRAPPTAPAPLRPCTSSHRVTQATNDAPPLPAPLGARPSSDYRTFVGLGDEQGGSGPSATPGSAAAVPIGTQRPDQPRPPSISLPIIPLESLSAAQFQSLIDILDEARHAGQSSMLRSNVALRLTQRNINVYQELGVTRFKEYAALAQERGFVELGGSGGHAWMSLLPAWHGKGRPS